MPITDIIHVTIKTMDLEATNRFYTEVLGMTFSDKRPPMNVDGSWLDFNGTQIHVLAGEGAFAEDDPHWGTGTVDHVAVHAVGYDEMRRRVEEFELEYRENDIPTAGLWQLFVRDPSGVMIEMNFRKADEPEGSEGPNPENKYYFNRF